MEAINFSKVLSQNDWKVQKGTSFIEFYYIGLSLNKSWEIFRFVEANKWYFEKMNESIKEQFRRMYKDLKRREETEEDEYK